MDNKDLFSDFFISWDKEAHVFTDKNGVYWEEKIIFEIIEDVIRKTLKEQIKSMFGIEISGNKDGSCILTQTCYIEENTLFLIIKAIQSVMGVKCYPHSGDEPWSWKGILTDEHIDELNSV